MILEGIKEEYREIKDYWGSRLLNGDGSFKEFSTIRFTNGYGSDKPSFDIQYNGIRIDTGIPEWGGSKETNVFVIELGIYSLGELLMAVSRELFNTYRRIWGICQLGNMERK